MDETDAAVGRAGPATVLLGAALLAAEAGWRATRPLRTLSSGVVSRVAEVVAEVAPATSAAVLRRGRSGLTELEALAEGLLRQVIERVVVAFVEAVDLTALVQEQVDLDAVAAGLDVDKVVARVDVEAIVRRVDLDAVAAGLDVDAVVARVDLAPIVRRIDVDGVAATIDVDAVVARVDMDAILARIDILGIAREVVDGIDLPEIIRHSTGVLTSDSVRTVRSEARSADDVVAGVVDRLLRRTRAVPSAPSSPSAPPHPAARPPAAEPRP